MTRLFRPVEGKHGGSADLDGTGLESGYAAVVRALEIRLRDFIDRQLTEVVGPDYWEQTIPEEVVARTRTRISERLSRHPYEYKSAFASGRTRLDFCDVSDYAPIVLDNWAHFKRVFIRKDEFERHLDAYRRLRNCIQHNRTPSDIELTLGQAAMTWLDRTLDQHDRATLYHAEGDAEESDGKEAAQAFEVERSGIESIHVDVGPTTKMARGQSRPRPLTEGAFFRILAHNVGEDGFRLARRLMSDAESLGAAITWRQASFSARLPDPGASGARLTLFYVNKEGELWGGWLANKLPDLDLPREIGEQYFEQVAGLFDHCGVKIQPTGDLTWTRGILLSELRESYDQFIEILSDTIDRIRAAAAARD